MPSEPVWLPLDVAIEMNRALVAMTAERHFVRDQGLLESALARPQNAFAYGEEDLVVLAVRVLAGIAQSHPFEEGNKRTWADAVIGLIEHRSTEEDFVRAIRPFVVPLG